MWIATASIRQPIPAAEERVEPRESHRRRAVRDHRPNELRTVPVRLDELARILGAIALFES
jgi:hypothetical protein